MFLSSSETSMLVMLSDLCLHEVEQKLMTWTQILCTQIARHVNMLAAGYLFSLCICSRVVSVQNGRVQIAVVTLSGNSLRQTVHTHCASVHQAAKLVAALLRVAGVTAGQTESKGSLPSGLWHTSPAGWLPRTWISSGTLRSGIEYGLPLGLPFYLLGC